MIICRPGDLSSFQYGVSKYFCFMPHGAWIAGYVACGWSRCHGHRASTSKPMSTCNFWRIGQGSYRGRTWPDRLIHHGCKCATPSSMWFPGDWNIARLAQLAQLESMKSTLAKARNISRWSMKSEPVAYDCFGLAKNALSRALKSFSI